MITSPDSARPPWLTSPRLEAPGVRHGFFTRRGGVSKGVYDSLNAGPGSRDEPVAVVENRRRIASAMGVGPEALLSCYQSHSTIAHLAESAWGGERPEGDAIVSATPGLVCGVLTADCAPVLLLDAEARVVGAAHAGWRGALDGVIGSVVAAMAALGAEPGRIRAAVGPCIGPDSYEVGPEFFERFVTHDPRSESCFRPASTAHKHWFDLPAYVLARLGQAGVQDAEWIGRDTCAEEAWFFSNRRAVRRGEPDYGRLIACIGLT